METHSCTPAWKNTLTEEPGKSQSMGSQTEPMTEDTEHNIIGEYSFGNDFFRFVQKQKWDYRWDYIKLKSLYSKEIYQ